MAPPPLSLRGAERRGNPLSCGRTKRKGNTFGEYAPSAHFPWYYVLATADARQISACHCEERSDAAIRSPCGSTKPKSNPLGEYEKHYEVALSTTTLPGFSAGTRIAAPVCALVRNDMQKTGACQRMQVGGHEEKCVDGSGFTWYNVLAYADTQQVSACHCEERSDVAIRISCGSAKQNATIPGEYVESADLP